MGLCDICPIQRRQGPQSLRSLLKELLSSRGLLLKIYYFHKQCTVDICFWICENIFLKSLE